MDPNLLTALAEPTRLQIVELLKTKPRSVNEIAEELGIRQPQASKHLRTLSEAGIVSSQPIAQQRIYSLNPEPFLRLNDWISSFEQEWSQRFNRLDNFINKLS